MKPGTPVRGQICEHVRGSRQYRVLIISNDEYNVLPGANPWAVTVERGSANIPGFAVPLNRDDPLPGAVVVIPHVLRCDPTALRRSLGFITNDTMNAVEYGLREFLNLP